MAIGMTTLSAQSLTFNDSTPADGTTEWASDGGGAIAAGSGESFLSIRVQVKVTFNGSSTGDVVLVSRKSADDGTTEDNIAGQTYSRTLAFDDAVSNVYIVTHEFYNFKYLDIGIQNDTGQILTIDSVKWEGTKLTGLATS